MTATVSTNSNNPKSEKRVSPALHNWKQNIAGDKKLFIILSILHIIAAPAVVLAAIISIYNGNNIDGAEPYFVIGCITTALAGFLGIFPAVDSFSCLHNKSVVDMKLSLPMTAKQRFFSNYLSGLFTYLAPFLGAQVLSLLFMCYGLIFMDGRTFEQTIRYWDDGKWYVKDTVPYVCDEFSEAAPVLLKLILCGVLIMLMLYTVTVLITVCCGSKFECIAYTLLVNAIIPLTIVCVTLSIFDNLYGITPYTEMYKIISCTSVAGGIYAAVDWVSGGDLFYTCGINHGVWVVVYLLITAAIGALAFFLYRKRRAEQVSKPFVFKLVYYITITCAMFCMVSLLGTAAELGLIPVIIITAIVYMIFEVVANRGFKRFWLSIIKYAVTFLAAFGVILIGNKTGGFGAVSRVPSASSVVSVELTANGYEGAYDMFDYAICYTRVLNDDYKNYFEAAHEPIVLKDKESIGIILDAHRAEIAFDKRCRAEDKEMYNCAAKNASFIIRYNLTGGRTLERNYIYYDAATADILSQLDLTEEYRSQIAEKYRTIISAIPKAYEKEMEFNRENNNEVYSERKREYKAYTATNIMGVGETGVSIDSLCKRGFYDQLAEAYSKDIMAITEENYYYSDLHNVWTVHLAGDMRFANAMITVPESFSNTVELLEYFDFDLRRVENASDEEIISTALTYSSMRWGFGLFTTREFRRANLIDDDIKVLPSMYKPYDYGECYVYSFDKDICDLVRSSLPMHIADENGYIISIYGNSAAVPAELADIAISVPRSARNEEIEDLYYETVYGESNNYY
ncbi:MAG: hypothetical protein K2N60_00870 [Oscillospiraceae bacterium]|nr:hypothetical protein [Oscillospiraceae bacterium]